MSLASSSSSTAPPRRPLANNMAALLSNIKIPKLKNHYVSASTTLTPDAIPHDHSLYIKDAPAGTLIVLESACVVNKVLIERCVDTRVVITGKVITGVLEIWRCQDVTVEVNSGVQTFQADICENLKVSFSDRKFFGNFVWSQCRNLNLSVSEKYSETSETTSRILTGLEVVQQQLLESDDVMSSVTVNPETDQFIVRFDPSTWRLKAEMVIRISGGYASTGREDDAAEARKEALMKRMAEVLCETIDVKKKKVEKEEAVEDRKGKSSGAGGDTGAGASA